MCAIAGILSDQMTVEAQESALRLMLRRTRHRGPDDEGVHSGAGVVLGACRLAQVDALGGAQPMSSPDGRWTLVFNGEIHNHRALRLELSEAWTFRTRSDTEVLLAALVIWGEAALLKLNGMFALFLWDHQKQCGLAARDRLGVKPLVYCRSFGCFAFASEAKALLDLLPGRPTVHSQSILEYWVAPFFSGVEHPMFADVESLPPGHLLRVSHHEISLLMWWSYDLRASIDQDADALRTLLHQRMPEAVALTLDTDATSAVFLSGGLDSTLIAASARNHGAACGYTIAFEGQAGFDYARELMVKSDDLPFAVQSARELGIEHRLVPVSRLSLAEDLRTLAIHNDALPAWEQELAQHHLAKAAAREHRAVLVGDAADETHFGYGFLLDERATSHPRHLVSRFGNVPLQAEWHIEAERLIARYEQSARDAGHDWETPAGRLRATTHLVMQRWLPRLLHNGDIHSMAHNVEARVPFADTELLNIAMRVHPHLGIKDGVEKWLLREASAGLMPEANRVRRKSSLSKDSACAATYQREAAMALDASAVLIGTWLDLPSLRALCNPLHVLTEMERALLFRVICFHHWAQHYNVRLP